MESNPDSWGHKSVAAFLEKKRIAKEKKKLKILSMVVFGIMLVLIGRLIGPGLPRGSGTCGDDLTWKLTFGGTLTISGTGEMTNDSSRRPPWDDHDDKIFSVVIKNGVTSIGDWAFSSCYSLTSITIPDSVTSIGDSAFFFCSDLTSITIPDSVTSIGDSAFSHCYDLTSITIPDSVTSIGDYAFSSCSGLTGITIPDSVTSIGDSAFSYCYGLTSITIPDSVTGIGDSAFSSCYGLTSITIPDSVTSIGDGVFSGCSNLSSMKVAEGNFIYHSAGNCIIETASKTLIAGCKATVIPVDGSVSDIGISAFEYCESLTGIIIPGCISGIGENAFSGCTGLISVTISDGVASIGSEAFCDCTGLTSITIPASVTHMYTTAFNGCTELISIEVSEENPVFHSLGNSIIETGAKRLFIGCKASVIPSDGSVTAIAPHAFHGCTGLTNIAIPDCIVRIGANAFYNCSGLTSISIPASVTYIGDWALDCGNLEDIYYLGTPIQWNGIDKAASWDGRWEYYTPHYTIHYAS